MQSWENFEHKLDSNIGKATGYSGKPSSFSAAKTLILLDPSKTKMVSYSAMKRTFLADGESISKII